MQYLYLWIDLLTLLGPIALSFDKKVAFYKNWRRLMMSIVIMMLIFIPWDIAFTVNEIWGFNPDYLCGFELLNLPIEEWLFFVVVPYATVFIYECCKAYFNDVLKSVAQPFLLLLSSVLIILGILNYDQWYTVINFTGVGVFILISIGIKQKYLGYLLLAFLISLVPFLFVNGLLTGSLLDDPIVWYNNQENLGVRIFTIPIEDVFYFLFFYLAVLIPYERFGRHS